MAEKKIFPGSLVITGSVTASAGFFGDGSGITGLTADLVGSGVVSQSIQLSGSSFQGRFTGSFSGDGSGITGITSDLTGTGAISSSAQIDDRTIDNLTLTNLHATGSLQGSSSYANAAGLVAGLSASQFLRSDADDSFTADIFTFASNDAQINLGPNNAWVLSANSGSKTVLAIDENWTIESGSTLYRFRTNGTPSAGEDVITKAYADANYAASGVVGGGSGPGSGSLYETNEGFGIGYTLKDRTAANYGDVGFQAIDLSYSDGASSTRGATGAHSLASGLNVQASGTGSVAFGVLSVADGNASIAAGRDLRAPSFGEAAFGIYNTDYLPGSTTGHVAGDRAFVVGIGTGTGARGDGLVVWKDGTVTAPSMSNAEITAAGSIALITKGYGDANYTTDTTYTAGAGLDLTGTTFSVEPTILALTASGVVSGSDQLSGSFQASGSYLSSLPSGTVSGSEQVSFINISDKPVGLISGSDQLSGSLVTIQSSQTVTGIKRFEAPIITGATGSLHMQPRSVAATYNLGNTLYFLSSDRLAINRFNSANSLILDFNAMTTQRTATFPDKSGTVAFIDDLTGGTVSGSSQIDHDATTNFVANEHIDHSTVSITAGNGLTGGGTIVSSRTLNVGAGTGISVSADTVAVDLSTLTDMTATMVGTDEFIVLDAGADRRKAANEIGLSIFNNDSGFTTNTGTVTSVNVGPGLDISNSTTTPTITLNLSEIPTSISDGDGDYFVVVNTSNSQLKLTKANINISGFNNDAGYTTNAGDITSVTAGNGLTGGGTSGGVTLTVGAGTGISVGTTTVGLANDRRTTTSTTDIYTGNSNDYTFYDASVGIRWYTAAAEEMRLEDDGDLHVDGDVIAFSTTVSDINLKDDIETISDAVGIILKLRGVFYTWNDTKRKGQKDIGVIAQEVEQVLPEIVHEKKMALVDDKVHKTVDYEKLTAVLIEAVKEQQIQIEELKKRLDELDV